MNRPEAYGIISAALERYRAWGFLALSGRVGVKDTEDVVVTSGVRYTLEVFIAWEDQQHWAVIIHGPIDDQNAFHSVPLEERVHVSNAA